MKEDLNKISLIVYMLFGFVIIFAFILLKTPEILRANNTDWFAKCQSNAKNIGTALELYAADNESQYPDKLEQLVPDYLSLIPTCDGVGRNDYLEQLRLWKKGVDTYSESYRVSSDRKQFTFFCKGVNHTGVGISDKNWPRYNSTDGLQSRP